MKKIGLGMNFLIQFRYFLELDEDKLSALETNLKFNRLLFVSRLLNTGENESIEKLFIRES